MSVIKHKFEQCGEYHYQINRLYISTSSCLLNHCVFWPALGARHTHTYLITTKSQCRISDFSTQYSQPLILTNLLPCLKWLPQFGNFSNVNSPSKLRKINDLFFLTVKISKLKSEVCLKWLIGRKTKYCFIS